MPRWRVYVIQPIQAPVEVEAESAEEASENVWDSPDYPNSSRSVGDGWDLGGEAYVAEIELIED